MAIFSRSSSSVEIQLKVEEGGGRPLRNLDKQNKKGFCYGCILLCKKKQKLSPNANPSGSGVYAQDLTALPRGHGFHILDYHVLSSSAAFQMVEKICC